MSNFNIMGSYSGIDMSVIDQMIEAEKAKGVQFTNRKEKIEREQGAWKDVGSRLTSLGQKTDVLSRKDTFESRTVKSSATANAAVSVTAGNSAPVGDYRVSVKQLATSSRLTGSSKINLDFEGMSDVEKKKNPLDRKMGLNESFKFKNADGKAFEIKVTSDDSLRKITENINKETKESGIRASVVDNRLILTDTKMGDREISIETNETTKKLGYTGSSLIGNNIDLDTFTGGKFSFKVDDVVTTIDITADESLDNIVKQINGEENTSGIQASITNGRLVLTDTTIKDDGTKSNREITVIGEEAAKYLGFVDTTTTLTGNEIKFEEIGIDGELALGDITVDIKLTDTLDDIVNKINLKTEDSGITASIEADNKLVLTADGDQNITVTDNKSNELIEKLSFTNPNKVVEDSVKSGSTVALAEQRGQGAIFEIDGLKIERDTNRVSDAIEGMAFTLSSVHAEGASDLISVTNNVQKGVDAVKEFIDQYNSVMNFIQTQTDVGTPSEDNNTTGALVGEGSIMRLQSNLRSMLGGEIKGGNKINIASKIGIQVDRYGVASLDEAKLNEALQEDPENVARFFYQPEAATLESGEPSTTQEKGMSELFKNLVESYTSSTKGIISTKNKSYERMVKEINQQIETFNDRIDKKRARYIQQFAALDEAMMRAESQMEYLYSQMNIE